MWNAAQMALWIVVFSAMMASGFLAETRSDGNPDFLRRACLLNKDKVCADWIAALRLRCENKFASACFLLGRVLSDGRVVPRDTLSATGSFRRACELGLSLGCDARAP
jgi:TPR repeat protein